jgi:hypothetical protein
MLIDSPFLLFLIKKNIFKYQLTLQSTIYILVAGRKNMNESKGSFIIGLLDQIGEEN